MTKEERIRSEARASVLKALAHPTRMFIVEKLMTKSHCVCELTDMIGADTSTVSKHLSILKHAGLVADEKRGTSVYYTLTCECIIKFIGCIEQVIRTNLYIQSAMFT